MVNEKPDKVESVGTFILGIFVIIGMIVAGIFLAVASLIAVPLVWLSDLIEKKVFKIKQVNLEDDPEWYKSRPQGLF